MIELDGSEIARIQKRLSELTHALSEKAVRSGLVYASIPLKDSMKRRAPSATGALVRSIGHESLSVTARARAGVPPGVAAITVGPKKVRVTARQAARGLTQSRFSGEGWLVNILDSTGAKPHDIYAGAANPKNAGRNRRLLKKYGEAVAKQRIGQRKKALSFGGRLVTRVKHPGLKASNFIGGALDDAGSQITDRFWVGVDRYLARAA